VIKEDDQILRETTKTFKSKKVMTVEQIAQCLNRSIPAARNRLKQWGTLTSYDNNGRYYVLPEIPKFDGNGLWSFKNIHFSIYGNLKNTLVNVIENSESGLNGLEIGQLLGLDPRSFLSHYGKSPGLRREKFHGHFIYFSSVRNRFEKQFNNQINKTESKTKSPLSAEVGIIVLVEKIKHPAKGVKQLTKLLQNKGISVTKRKINDFLSYYGLQKKTPDSPL
jgi:hypothetical protein